MKSPDADKVQAYGNRFTSSKHGARSRGLDEEENRKNVQRGSREVRIPHASPDPLIPEKAGLVGLLLHPVSRYETWRRLKFSRVLTALWRKGIQVNGSWRTCRGGGKTTARQRYNSSENGRFSQGTCRALWINKLFFFNSLQTEERVTGGFVGDGGEVESDATFWGFGPLAFSNPRDVGPPLLMSRNTAKGYVVRANTNRIFKR